MLSFNGIQQFWAIQFLTQNFLETQRQEGMKISADLTLGEMVRHIREEFFGQIIVYVYQQALERKPLFDNLKHLKLSAQSTFFTDNARGLPISAILAMNSQHSSK
ncbi:hypothetical protein BK126_04840 [Paenibacillus sp. FSL H7-0326]|uniref:hypothetical protein n=1 Tax=Paenibacillus sp. FSL H7-0326 TaxID=1921144 RepID=UPI00096ED093|nr:hypothetical protein [Paenibacillus sp. FSL H7-0326]OMC71421.1 hypothetical protein BK126_04840 [Paenibacillus sp. FSL H7-0326]